MPKLKVLSGNDLIKIFSLFGFVIQSQKGSHIKLSKFSLNQKQVLIIPNHKEIDIGTLKAIFRQANKYVSEKDLFPFFYSE
jgi:predicted RNA binding protein YcfA (HicA-like mRNA interferase family)